MKNMIFVTFTLQGGGAERVILTLANAYLKLDYQVHIISFKHHMDYPIDPRIHVHPLNYQRYRWLPKPLRNRLFAHCVDAYIKHNIKDKIEMIVSNLLPVDRVMHFSRYQQMVYVLHNTMSSEYELSNSKMRKSLEKIYCNHPVIAVSQGVADDYLRHFPFREDIRAIYNPIDKEGIEQQASAFVPEEQNYIVHVGSFKPAKNHQLLINAYAQSKQTKPLLLLGVGEDFEQRKAQVQSLGLQDKVVFKGFQKNPYPYIKHSQGMVLCSIYEGLPTVINEALALNIPVISSDCPSGPCELLASHCLVPMNDIIALKDKLNDLMDNPSQYHSPFMAELLPENVAKEYLAFKNEFI